MTTPAFIVEGVLEQRAIQKLCPGARVVKLGANGDQVAPKVVAKHIEAKVRMFSNRHFPIFVVMDREKRSSTSAVIRAEILSCLEKSGLDAKQFIIIVNDRDIETLMLCHVSKKGLFVEECTADGVVDGMNGEAELRKRLLVAGIRYHKTTIGVDLLIRCVPQRMLAQSPNFRSFFEQARAHCGWLRG